ncbi:bifunctional 3-(3-hydroxy-phenyl)propionate/3-hydroxycinnamic acid hydroxylase [Novosphingobium sp. PASSN1]|uniref:bifunctional 3-(3-hydroxy-phenyl)propionate/3-hydroxycinnamic acid hydroxylase MhpA n=1 Tax=Novosphingobium sp. PASSN1 TaxID=2015561 RepID=UPI000BC6E335|nr:bifunctional 3-(3-hydroxy-phenyl)propionate/3-hydroxycinnamic acid hydroxylase [Novosphingobium sp. PASSN1]OYU34325.1 MAG: monooxygenase [Novosphingobium sp. PASSN1]
MSRHDCDVLIVGGGPTGITLGLFLASAGLSTIIAEKEQDIYPLPRGAHIDHETVRILQNVGVADQVMATSKPGGRYDFINAERQVLLRFEWTAPGASGWPISNMIHQPSLEAALRTRLAAASGTTLHVEWTFVSMQFGNDGVTANFATPDGPRSVRARYIVGADGARSPVRDAAGIEVDDLGFDEPWLVVDTIVHDQSRLPDRNLQLCDPNRPTTCVMMGEGRHRWEFMIKPGETADEVLDDQFIANLLKPWNVEGAVSIERKAFYRFYARVAKQWRVGPVLLAGDAAHQMPPFAGQGLCSGLRDAANLWWKLADVIKNGADDAVLDAYQPEREPNVRGIIDMAILMGRTVCVTDPQAAAARDTAMLADRAAGKSPDGETSYPPISAGKILVESAGAGTYFPQPWSQDGLDTKLDDVTGSGPVLFVRSGAPVVDQSGLPVFDLADPAVAFARDELEAWLSLHNASSVLVRPDRYVFGTGEPNQLVEAWTRWQAIASGMSSKT